MWSDELGISSTIKINIMQNREVKWTHICKKSNHLQVKQLPQHYLQKKKVTSAFDKWFIASSWDWEFINNWIQQNPAATLSSLITCEWNQMINRRKKYYFTFLQLMKVIKWDEVLKYLVVKKSCLFWNIGRIVSIIICEKNIIQSRLIKLPVTGIKAHLKFVEKIEMPVCFTVVAYPY